MTFVMTLSFMVALIGSIFREVWIRHHRLGLSPWLWKEMIQPYRSDVQQKIWGFPPTMLYFVWKNVSAQNQIVTFGNQMLSILAKVVKNRKVNSCGIKLHRDLIKRVDCANVYPAPPPHHCLLRGDLGTFPLSSASTPHLSVTDG